MVYRIKEKPRFWAIDYEITDRSGDSQYKVVRKDTSLGGEFSFQERCGRELARISQKLLSLKPCYQIVIDDHVYAEVTKDWS